MPDKSGDSIGYAKQLAIRYLSRAPRSIYEVEQKLKAKGIARGVINNTIGYLVKIGFLNDDVFAANWIGSRIRLRLWGREKIVYSLAQKGVSGEIIRRAMDAVDTEFDERKRAKTALEKWFKKQKTAERSKERAFRHLRVKGYLPSAIIAAIQEYYREQELPDEGE